jgi:hypothetical protein
LRLSVFARTIEEKSLSLAMQLKAPHFLLSVFIFSFCSSNKKEEISISSEVTWSEHIAPVVFKNCTPCHRPGESGPFTLLNYQDAVKNANKIKFVTSAKFMPPWPADPSYSHFADERFLSDSSIALIKKWVEDKMPRGDSSKEPSAPVFYAGSFFGKPDMVIKMPKPVEIKGNGTDAFLMIKFPFKLEEEKYVQYVEFVPNQRKLVHHVNGHLLSYDPKRSFDYSAGETVLADALNNYTDAYSKMGLTYTDNQKPELPALFPNVVYYLPGYIPPVYNEDIGGFRIPKNGVFFLKNIHYGPSNKDVLDSSYLNIFFRRSPPKRLTYETQLGTFGISKIEPELIVPPNEIKTFHTQATIHADISILSVNPHMHLIGKTFVAYALPPKGDTIKLVRINKWDFRWQYYYTYEHPVKIPKGSTIHVYGTYDNTDKNPNNPFHPPQQIEQGVGNESMRTTEEMFQFIFTYMPYKDGDEKISLKK